MRSVPRVSRVKKYEGVLRKRATTGSVRTSDSHVQARRLRTKVICGCALGKMLVRLCQQIRENQ